MKPRIITGETLAAFRRHLQEAERRPATVAKYLREMRRIRRALEFILRKEGKQRKEEE